MANTVVIATESNRKRRQNLSERRIVQLFLPGGFMVSLQRTTRQKQAIRAAFDATDRPLSPDEVLSGARVDVKRLSLATVYRNLSALVDEGWLQVVEIPGSTPRYERAGKAHHHHFHCTTCERVYEVAGCAVSVAPQLPKGFHVTGHEFYLFGSCPECS